MIKFSLACERGHGFESWFPDGESFETQARRGLVQCAVCDSVKVRKALMAPAVHGTRRAEAAPTPAQPQPVALIDDTQRELRAAITELKRKIEANTVDVGVRFPEVARAIHSGDEPERAIRGRASLDEARALLEDGIQVMPIPMAPDEVN
jgi:hypothetical protein